MSSDKRTYFQNVTSQTTKSGREILCSPSKSSSKQADPTSGFVGVGFLVSTNAHKRFGINVTRITTNRLDNVILSLRLKHNVRITMN